MNQRLNVVVKKGVTSKLYNLGFVCFFDGMVGRLMATGNIAR